MNQTIRTCCVFGFAALMVLAAASDAAAQSDNSSKSSFPLLQESMINRIVDGTAKQVARRYDLNPDQANVARDMLQENTWKVVNKHFDQLAVLMPKMFQLRASAEDPSRHEVQDFARQFAPIMKEAGELIFSENLKFHEILDEKQKRIHQQDLDQMRSQIAEINQRLDRWSRGDYKPGEFRYGLIGQPPRNQQQNRQNPDGDYDQTSTSYWELYVKMFVEAFQLDQGQRTMAYSVLSEIKTRAEAYRRDHQRQLTDAQQALAQLQRSTATKPIDKEQLQKLQQQVEQLNQPLLTMFDELCQRLLAIPTDQQRRVAAELLGDQGTPRSPQGITTTRPAGG
ncbi:MAG: hypothetical protein GXY33_09715 [Phycisphaerae bacterium]|nr:hypothetical protein [Phycisphaerae bacterium]